MGRTVTKPFTRPGRHALIPAVLSLLSLLMVSTSAPASAAEVSVRDPRGDAPAHVDLLRATYGYEGTYVSFRWTFRSLGAATVAEGVAVHVCSGVCTDFYEVRVSRVQDRTRAKLTHQGDEPQRCPGLTSTWNWQDDTVTARVPTSCIEHPDVLYMQASATDTETTAYDLVPNRRVRRG